MEETINIITMIISIFTLFFSIYVHFENRKNKNQIEEQKRELYKLTINKEKEEIKSKKRAKLNTQTKTIERNQHKLTIKNNGESTAENVTLNILTDEKIKRRLFQDMNSVLPATIKSGNEITFKYKTMSQPHLRIFNAELIWDDEFKKNNKERIKITQ